MEGLFAVFYRSPIGRLKITGDRTGVSSIEFVREPGGSKPGDASAPGTPAVLIRCRRELGEYFEGKRTSFDIPLNLAGTPFRKRVWKALLKIPYGRTASYKEIAAVAGNAKATRAVGGANHDNPVSIIVPCHRVIGSDGSLTGYGGGLWRKEWLLAHEQRRT